MLKADKLVTEFRNLELGVERCGNIISNSKVLNIIVYNDDADIILNIAKIDNDWKFNLYEEFVNEDDYIVEQIIKILYELIIKERN